MKEGFRQVFVVIAILSIVIQTAAADKIKMGYFNLVPHIFYNHTTGKLDGASFDYFTAVASAMGYKIQWIGPLPFPRLIRYLKNGTIDGSLMMNKNPDRETFMLYPEMPYHLVQRILVLRKENTLNKIDSIDDVLGYRIGFMEDAHLSPFIKDNRDKITLELIGGKDWVRQNLLKLSTGRLDAVYDLNAETMRYAAKQLNIQNKVKILTVPEPAGGVNVVFSRAARQGKVLLTLYEQEIRKSKWIYRDFLRPYID